MVSHGYGCVVMDSEMWRAPKRLFESAKRRGKDEVASESFAKDKERHIYYS